MIMIELLKSQKGSFGIAIVVAIIAILSGASLSSVAFRDLHSMRIQLDSIQQFHILRSEFHRGRLVASVYVEMDLPPPITILPDRNISINFGSHRTRYTARTKLNTYEEFGQTGFLIRSLISAARGSGQAVTQEMRSPVKKYGEHFIQDLATLAIFHYFSDVDRAIDNVPGNIRFFGQDFVHGRVHSNTDIWIRDFGGWPTFTGLVTTSGVVRVYPGGGTNFPEEEIFLGGLIENYPRVAFDPTADLIRANGLRPFGSTEEDNKIAFVNLEGGGFDSWVGTIEETLEEFPIYDSYPPYGPIGNQTGVNNVVIRDTTWTTGPSWQVTNQSVWVPYELWISGTVAGGQSWGSPYNVYIKDDLLYYSTEAGDPPDGGDPNQPGYPQYPVNNTDYLGIISEKSIFIQYGYKDPIDEVRYKPNTDDIYIYGALCAMGEDTGPNQYGIHVDAGIFTFQYQFPKGSTPAQVFQGQFYENIDLYRFRYPTSPFEPWPPGLDYPWYNPLWPEPGPVFGHPAIPNPHGAPTVVYLRGDINLFGSIAQRFRGFVRRSGGEDYDTGFWHIEEGMFGRHTGMPSGYNKEYYFDKRFETVGPPDFPLVKFEGYETEELMELGFKTLSTKFKSPPANF